MQKKNWYQNWFGKDYLDLYQHRSPEEAADTVGWLIKALHLQNNLRLFDLACGAGRHSSEFISHGFSVIGLDLSRQLLQKASRDRRQNLLRGDMRYIPVKSGQFDLALSLFTSFGYFTEDNDNVLVLKEVSRILKPGGRYILDFLNEIQVRTNLIPSDDIEIGGKQVKILRWIDESRNRIEKRIQIAETVRAFREYRESVKLYSKEQLADMLSSVSIKPVAIFGDYASVSFTPDSPRLIIIGEKNGS